MVQAGLPVEVAGPVYPPLRQHKIAERAAHMAEPEQGSTVAANIPFLFYDVIGRMFPGGFLIVGACLSWLHFLPLYWFDSHLGQSKFSEPSVGFATLALGLAILIFAVTSTFLGFILAALSNLFVEKLMRYFSPYDLDGLGDFLGVENIAFLKTQFLDQFGAMPKDDSLNESSFLSAYYCWKFNPTLGAMQGRWDSDLLAAQSFVLVSAVLIAMGAYEGRLVGFDLFLEVWLAILGVIFWGSFLAFKYHRKKRVYGRFGLFLTLVGPLRGKVEAKSLQTENLPSKSVTDKAP